MVPGMMAGVPGMMPPAMPGAAPTGPPSKCIRLVNMFDPNGDDERNDPHFFEDLCEDVSDEVKKHGAVLESHAVPESAGHLYLKFESEAAAAASVGAGPMDTRAEGGHTKDDENLGGAEGDGSVQGSH